MTERKTIKEALHDLAATNTQLSYEDAENAEAFQSATVRLAELPACNNFSARSFYEVHRSTGADGVMPVGERRDGQLIGLLDPGIHWEFKFWLRGDRIEWAEWGLRRAPSAGRAGWETLALQSRHCIDEMELEVLFRELLVALQVCRTSLEIGQQSVQSNPEAPAPAAKQQPVDKPARFEMAQAALVDVLYALLRDHVPAGAIEEAAQQAVIDVAGSNRPIRYSNEYLAGYAEKLARYILTVGGNAPIEGGLDTGEAG